jgi:hypothetical protein
MFRAEQFFIFRNFQSGLGMKKIEDNQQACCFDIFCIALSLNSFLNINPEAAL